MEDKLNELLIEIKCSNLYLHIEDRTTLSLNIKNNLDIVIEKIYIYNFFNNEYLKIVNNNENESFIHDELIYIKKLIPKENKEIKFDLLLKKNFKDISLNFFSIMHYKVNVNGENIKKQIKSNIITFNINEYKEIYLKDENTACKESLYGKEGEFIHIVDKKSVYVHDIINNKIIINNKNKPKIKNLYFKDSSNKFLQYIKKTLFINGIPRNYDNISDYIYIQDSAQEEIIITYKTKVTNGVENENLIAKSNIEYYLAEDTYNDKKLFDVSSQCNIIVSGIKTNIADLEHIKKEVNTSVCKAEDILTFHLNILNQGNVEALNIKIKEENIGYFEFIENSLYLNEENLKGENIFDGIYLDILNSKESFNIKYKLKVTNVCKKDFINTVTVIEYIYVVDEKKIIEKKIFKNKEIKIYVMNNNILLEQKVSKSNLLLGHSFEYFLDIKNIGNTICKDAILNINIPKGLIFIENTLKISKSLKSNIIDKNIKIYIEKINLNEIINISLKFKVIDTLFENCIKLNSNIYGSFYLEEYNIFNEKQFESEILMLNIDKYDITLNRECDLDYIMPGDKIKITSIIKNNGTLTIYNAIFSEVRQPLLNIVCNSIYINGKQIEDVDIYVGLSLGNIESGKTFIINCTYEYVNDFRQEEIILEACLKYIEQNSLSIKKEKNIINNNINIQTSICLMKELNINGEIILNNNEPDISEISYFTVVAEILNYYEIKTIKNTSYGNQILNGKKIFIEGILKEKFEYIIDSQFESLYFLERQTPFSTYMVIPYKYNREDIILSCEIKNKYFKNISNRKIFKSIFIQIDSF